jgi:hypothetical protein
MVKSTALRITLVPLAALLLAAGGWLYTRRVERIEIATYVPESALGFLEVNDLPLLFDRMTSTKAWQQLAPAYGVSDKLNYVGKAGRVGWLTRLTGNQEAAIFSHAQVAIVITSLEVRGEAVKPRMALVAETHSRAGALQGVVEKRLPELAQTLFGQATKQTGEYTGVPVLTFSASDRRDRRLLAAQIEGELILANDEEPLHSCIDTRLGHVPPIAGNFYLPKARPAVSPAGGAEVSAFGFVTGEGVKRLLRFGTYMAAGGIIGKAALAGAVGEVFTDFSAKTCDGIAYGMSFENGQVVDRYSLLFKPDLTERLKAIIKATPNQPRALNLVPASTREATVIKIINPSRTLDNLEKAISSRVDAAQSFLLHQYLIGMREAAFGAKSGELTGAAVGDEIISFNLTAEPLNRVWLITARDRTMMARLAESMLGQFQEKRVAAIRHEDVAGFDIMISSEPSRGAAVFIGDVLALGARAQLLRLIEAYRAGQSLPASRQFATANQLLQDLPSAPVVSFASAQEESNAMMVALARASGTARVPAQVPALARLPLAATATSLGEQGLIIESRSPFGNLPFMVSLADGSTDRNESNQ